MGDFNGQIICFVFIATKSSGKIAKSFNVHKNGVMKWKVMKKILKGQALLQMIFYEGFEVLAN